VVAPRGVEGLLMGAAARLARTFVACVLVAIACGVGNTAAEPTGASAMESATRFPQIAILAYHDVSDSGPPASLTVRPAELRRQIRALRAQGWTILSLGGLLAHREHPEQLPPRVAVLTFDDGYCSFAANALPVLREEGVHPTLAIISSFVGTTRSDAPPFLDWDELRAIAASGDVDFASHTHALHQYDTCDPQRDTAPSVGVRRWLADAGRYEDREQYRSRLADDLAETQRQMREQLGAPATVLMWPYGVHNEMARDQAAHAGFLATLSLEQRPVTASDLRAGCLPRYLVYRGMGLDDGDSSWVRADSPPLRMVQVDLDALWSADEAVFRERLTTAVTRARALGANHVVLPVCPDPRRDGRLARSWAMNHQVPLLADVWAMVAARFRVEGMRVWAQVPSLDLTWAWEREPALRIGGRDWSLRPSRWSTVLSPELPETRRAAIDFLTDLAVYLQLDGIVFDDDTALLPSDRLVTTGSADPGAKAVAVRRLLEECKQAVRAWRPECRFARVVPPSVVERTGLDAQSAISLEDGFASDELTLVSLPAPRPRASERAAAARVEKLGRQARDRWWRSGGAGDAPVVLLVPTQDPASGRPLPASWQEAVVDAIRASGLAHAGAWGVKLEGELPLGLLERRPEAPAVQATGRD